MSTSSNPEHGHQMSRDYISGFLHPSNVASREVLSWLKTAQVSTTSFGSHASWITFTAPVSKAEKIYKTRFYTFEHKKSKAIVVRTLKYSLLSHTEPPLLGVVPATLADLVADCSVTITPHRLRSLSRTRPDSRKRLGISGFLDHYERYSGFHRSLDLYASSIPDTNFSVVLINGGLNLQNPLEISTEASLDIQYAAALADNPLTTFYSSAGRGPTIFGVGDDGSGESDHEPYLGQFRYLLDLPDDELPAVLSTSYGEVGQRVPETYAKTTCNMFAQLGAPGGGVSVIFSSGDS
ncbi:uncharacterized protein BDW43DRAFT_315144 [Aspergillus alliaceus]|uniref:uncharacterized protein n=1 Tax=Petromyces alliaceus TaxID=209559 RepID=UPI0012A52F3F|nr:uncharacterized protein BDW43DRAFT_315144 [Aspergillus alliaceus]KAB8229160.1 hypothetical protein BDW43DRAFT_315144 [Aspergillus alliaceus]